MGDENSTISAMANKRFIDNGLLFFLNNKVNFMVHEDIITLCKDFYSEKDIDEAKVLMYSVYKQPESMKTHRGNMKKHNDLKEMVTFISQNSLEDAVFCITQCTAVPPVAMDFIDAAALNRHISLLRSDMTVMQAAYRRLAGKIEKQEDPSVSTSAHSSLEHSQSTSEIRHSWSNAVKDGSKKRESRQATVTDGDLTKQIDEETASNASSSEWETQRHQRRRQHQLISRKRRTSSGPPGGPARHTSTHGGKGNRRPAIIGMGTGKTLSAAEPRRDISLFISRLRPDVESDTLRSHVSQVAGVSTVECELLEMRHPNYRSYKVCIKGMLKSSVHMLYDAENWDNGILVKRWFN